MTISMTTFSVLLLASAATTAIAGVMATRRWEAAAAPAIVAAMVTGTLWSASYAMLLLELPPGPRFWTTFLFIGVIATPPAFLVFALIYTENRRWINRFTITLLALEPLIVLPVLFTDAHHGLFLGETHFGAAKPFEGGPVFWFNAYYAYAIDLLAFYLLLRAFLRASSLQRRQTGILLLGALTPSLLNLFSVLVLASSAHLDATPVGFAFTGLAMVYNLRRNGLFDLIPVARHAVVERMTDGVLVLDPEGRLIDSNAAGRALFGLNRRGTTGQRITTTFAHRHVASQLLALQCGDSQELSLPGPDARTVDVRATDIRTERTPRPARLIVAREITALKRVEAALRQQLARNEALRNELRQEAIRDPLTGLYNRRLLEETLEREIERAERDDGHLAVALLDIDRFKYINDSYGHHVGDHVLVALAELLRRHARASDAVCRYGGEEFVLILPDADRESARRRLDDLREIFAQMDLSCGHYSLKATFSVGVAAMPYDGTDAATLLTAADRALYEAKEAGRNRVVNAGQRPVESVV